MKNLAEFVNFYEFQNDRTPSHEFLIYAFNSAYRM